MNTPQRYIRHKYTLTEEAYQALTTQVFPSVPSKSTLWKRQSDHMVDWYGNPVSVPGTSYTRKEGLSHALTAMARSFDLYEWTPNPTPHPYGLTNPTTGEPILVWHNPQDTSYLQSLDQDDTPWEDLDEWERQTRQLEFSRSRYNINQPRHPLTNKLVPNQHSLALQPSVREYYASLLQFFNIPLLPRATHPHSLTTHVSTVLEAIGTKHLLPPPNYLQVIQEPNQRKVHSSHRVQQVSRVKHAHSGARKYGNLSGMAWTQHEWRKLPRLDSGKWAQADVDWAATNGLLDLALEAISLNPAANLHLPTDNPAVQQAAAKHQQAATPTATPTTRAHHIDLVLPATNQPTTPTTPSLTTPPTYYYKGRDITPLVMEAHDIHYSKLATRKGPTSFPNLQPLADEWAIPLPALRRLATKEHVRRVLSHG